MLTDVLLAVLLGSAGVLAFLIPIIAHQNGAKWYVARNIYHMIVFSTAGTVPLVARSVLTASIAIITWAMLLGLYYAITGENAITTFYDIMKREGVSASERSLYTAITAIGLIVLMILMWETPLFFTAGMFVMAYGDALAEIIGKKEGEVTYEVISEKTVEGSLTVFGVSSLVLLILLGGGGLLGNFSLLYLAGIALLAMVVEAVSVKFLDNVLMPYLTALLLRYPLA